MGQAFLSILLTTAVPGTQNVLNKGLLNEQKFQSLSCEMEMMFSIPRLHPSPLPVHFLMFFGDFSVKVIPWGKKKRSICQGTACE